MAKNEQPKESLIGNVLAIGFALPFAILLKGVSIYHNIRRPKNKDLEERPRPRSRRFWSELEDPW